MGFFLLLFLFVGFTVLGELLRPKPKLGSPQPSGLGDIQVPTAEEGRAIPVVFGTCNVKGPNVVWYGDLRVAAIKQKVKTGLFSSKKVTTGYRYYIGAQLALCHGEIDDFTEVRFDDRSIPGGSIVIDATNDTMRIGTISPDVVGSATIAHGTYTDLAVLASAAQTALRAADPIHWRVCWGYDVQAGQNVLNYSVKRGASTAYRTGNVATGIYETGAALAAALEATIYAAEALVSGGPEISAVVKYVSNRFEIHVTPRFTDVTEFVMVGGYGSSAEYDTTIHPTIGARLNRNGKARNTSNAHTLPGTWTSDYETAAFKFSFAGDDYGTRKFDILSPLFTAVAPFGLRREVPAQTGGHPWYGLNIEQALVETLDGGGGQFYTGDLGGGLVVGCGITLPTDPGDVSGYRLKVSAGLGGPAGNASFEIRLYGGLDPDVFGGPSTLAATSAVFGPYTDVGVFHSNTHVMSQAEVTAFRAAGGFSTGCSIVIGCTGSYGASALFGTCSMEIPQPTYAQMGSLLAREERRLEGVSVVEDADKFTIQVDQPNLFGGDEREGGVRGTITLYKGTLTQVADTYLTGILGALPAYRGIVYAVLGGRPYRYSSYNAWPGPFYIGTTPYPKLISFVVSRYPNGLGLAGGAHSIQGDANPACMLYEILTNARWGLGLSANQINVQSFTEAGYQLAGEEFGLSMLLDTAAKALELMESILRHVDGVIFPDPETGLVKLKLARANYGPADPIMIDESRIASCSISRPSIDDTRNIVKVSFTSRADGYVTKVVQAQNRANLAERNDEASEDIYPFPGLSRRDLAQRVAGRVLKTVSYPLAPVTLEVDRIAYGLRPGDVFRFSWSPESIVDMTCRVIRIRTGTLVDGGIAIDAVEDVFATGWTAYAAPSSAWVDPVTEPDPLVSPRLLEAPYGLVVGPEILVMTLAGPAVGSVVLGYKVWSDAEGGNLGETNDVQDLTPIGTLVGDLYYTNATIRVSTGPLMDTLQSASEEEFLAGRNLLLVDDEVIAWQGIVNNGDGSYTVSGCVRGVLDTTPRVHGAGAVIYFLSAGAGLTSPQAYGSDVAVRAKLPAYNSLGGRGLSETDEVALTTTSRARRPYVPTNVRINLESYPGLAWEYDVQVAWSHRNRLAEWSYADAGATDSPETGCTYTLRFYGQDGLLKRTYAGVTGTTKTWDTEAADSGGIRNQIIRVELECVNAASEVSFQTFVLIVSRQTSVNTPQRTGGTFPMRRRRGRIVRALNT